MKNVVVVAGGLLVLGSLVACALKSGSPRAAGEDPPPMTTSEPVSWAATQQEHELGRVHFARGYDAARARATREGKPLFVLFDEVPG